MNKFILVVTALAMILIFIYAIDGALDGDDPPVDGDDPPLFVLTPLDECSGCGRLVPRIPGHDNLGLANCEKI